MARRQASERDRLIRALLDRHGRTFCTELGIQITRDQPSVLFRWLCATMLFSARISAETAVKAAMALADRGWTTPEKLLAASWEERTRVLNRSGYARYDESTSTKLADAAQYLVDEYDGDLRRMRESAKRDPLREHELVQGFKGIGPTGADIFCREMQAVWDELYPFVDAPALEAARHLGLGGQEDLPHLVKRADFPVLVTALVRTKLADDYDMVEEWASPHPSHSES